jgi:homoserine kinase
VIRVRAPASTANLGPGFDCAAVALDLWNELEVGEGERGEEEDHLGIRAFALVGQTRGKTFRFTNRIPIGRGLGSSAATIALGLVAAILLDGRSVDPEALLARGVELEGHADNLAAALAGGVCLTWEAEGGRRIARIRDDLPLTPIAIVPDARVATADARAALPERVAHADAAFTAGRAALLGAGLAAGDATILAQAFHDRLHEPYRADNAPLLAAVRSDLPAGAVGATLSGSGPTAIVWAREEEAGAVARELTQRFPTEQVLSLTVSGAGAGRV